MKRGVLLLAFAGAAAASVATAAFVGGVGPRVVSELVRQKLAG